MEPIKFWTINCRQLDDREFEQFVSDLERYIKTRQDHGALPQQQSDAWLKQFSEDYAHWSGRSFYTNRFPLMEYFQIDSRLSYHHE